MRYRPIAGSPGPVCPERPFWRGIGWPSVSSGVAVWASYVGGSRRCAPAAVAGMLGVPVGDWAYHREPLAGAGGARAGSAGVSCRFCRGCRPGRCGGGWPGGRAGCPHRRRRGDLDRGGGRWRAGQGHQGGRDAMRSVVWRWPFVCRCRLNGPRGDSRDRSAHHAGGHWPAGGAW